MEKPKLRRKSTQGKNDNFWWMLEENGEHYELMEGEQDPENPKQLWDRVCKKPIKLEGPCCTTVAN